MLAPGMSFYRVTREETIFKNISRGVRVLAGFSFVPLKACSFPALCYLSQNPYFFFNVR